MDRKRVENGAFRKFPAGVFLKHKMKKMTCDCCIFPAWCARKTFDAFIDHCRISEGSILKNTRFFFGSLVIVFNPPRKTLLFVESFFKEEKNILVRFLKQRPPLFSGKNRVKNSMRSTIFITQKRHRPQSTGKQSLLLLSDGCKMHGKISYLNGTPKVLCNFNWVLSDLVFVHFQ